MNKIEEPRFGALRLNVKLAVSFGGGTNSSAILCGFRERGIVPDLVIFADTGAENPRTYLHVEIMKEKVKEWWSLELIVVQAKQTIIEHCDKTSMLPSLAYGRRSCSQKFKHEPMEKYIKAWAKERGITEITKCIGYDAGEAYRSNGKPTEKKLNKRLTEFYWYPLVEWGWLRAECIEAIGRQAIPQPGKSACYFCPASKRSEVLTLGKNYPALLAKSLEIEANAQKRHREKIGLGGRRNLWADWIKMDEAQAKLFWDIEPHEIPCDCLDG